MQLVALEKDKLREAAQNGNDATNDSASDSSMSDEQVEANAKSPIDVLQAEFANLSRVDIV